jgi:hypothetical protein
MNVKSRRFGTLCSFCWAIPGVWTSIADVSEHSVLSVGWFPEYERQEQTFRNTLFFLLVDSRSMTFKNRRFGTPCFCLVIPGVWISRTDVSEHPVFCLVIPGVWISRTDVSKHHVCSTFEGHLIRTTRPMKMEKRVRKRRHINFWRPVSPKRIQPIHMCLRHAGRTEIQRRLIIFPFTVMQFSSL